MLFSFPRKWEHTFRLVLSSSHEASLPGRRLEPRLVKAGDRVRVTKRMSGVRTPTR
jgi:hypothetical protein